MAITKIIGATHPVSNSSYRTLYNTIEYIKNAAKTNNGEYVGSQHCTVDDAYRSFVDTQGIYGKNPNKKSDRTGYHLCVSWSPEENVSEEQALKVLEKFCEKYIPEHEAIYSVHNDKGHMHGHICFNSVNWVTGYKYRYNSKDWENQMQPIIDKLCKDMGLHQLKDDTGLELNEYEQFRSGNGYNKEHKKKSNNKYYNEKNEVYSISDYIRDDVDFYILNSNSLEDFKDNLKEAGYQIKEGKSEKYGTYTAVKYPGMNRFKRLYSLGKDYSDNAIRNRIITKNERIVRERIHDNYRYIVPEKILYVKINYSIYNSIYNKKCYDLFHLGLKPKGDKRESYKVIKEAIKDIEKIKTQIMLINDSEGNFDVKLKECQGEIHKINNKIKENNYEKRMLQDNIKRIKKYKSIQTDVRCDKEQLDRLKRNIDAFPLTEKETIKKIQLLKEDNSNLYNAKKTEKKRENAIKDLISEYNGKKTYKEELTREQLTYIDKNSIYEKNKEI